MTMSDQFIKDTDLLNISGGNEDNTDKKTFSIIYTAANGVDRVEEVGPFKTKRELEEEIVRYRRVLKSMGCKNITIQKP